MAFAIQLLKLIILTFVPLTVLFAHNVNAMLVEVEVPFNRPAYEYGEEQLPVGSSRYSYDGSQLAVDADDFERYASANGIDLNDNFNTNNEKRSSRMNMYRRGCIRRAGSCDNRPGECCYNSSCRCNLWGTNCRCQRMGLFQKWG